MKAEIIRIYTVQSESSLGHAVLHWSKELDPNTHHMDAKVCLIRQLLRLKKKLTISPNQLLLFQSGHNAYLYELLLLLSTFTFMHL